MTWHHGLDLCPNHLDGLDGGPGVLVVLVHLVREPDGLLRSGCGGLGVWGGVAAVAAVVAVRVDLDGDLDAHAGHLSVGN